MKQIIKPLFRPKMYLENRNINVFLQITIIAEVESRTQCSRPRPRTAFPRTEPLEAKDSNARGQGHRRKCSPKKKNVFKKFFSGDLQIIGVPRIFDWGRPKPQIT